MNPHPFHGFSVSDEESPECRRIRGQLRLSTKWIVLGKVVEGEGEAYRDGWEPVREPVTTEELDGPQERGTSWIYVSSAPGTRYRCPDCNGACRVECYRERRLHHLTDMGNSCMVVARVPKLRCLRCNAMRMAPLPLAEARVSYTRMLARTVLSGLRHGTRRDVAKANGISVDVVDGILEGQIRLALCEQDLSYVSGVYVDEVQFGHGQDYVSIFADQHHKVIFACRGHGKDVLERFSDHLVLQGGDPGNVRVFSADMSQAYESGITEQFPNARLVWDRFHLVKSVNDALNDVRKRTVRRAKGVRLSKVKYVVLRRKENMDGKQLERLEEIRLASPELAQAFDMKEAFCRIIKTDDPAKMEVKLLYWISWVLKEGPKELAKKAERMLQKMELISNWGIHRVSNSVCEGLNKKAQDTRRQAYGFRNVQNFFAMILLRQGGLVYRF